MFTYRNKKSIIITMKVLKYRYLIKMWFKM